MKQGTMILLCAWLMWAHGAVYKIVDNDLKLRESFWDLQSAYPSENGHSICNADTKTMAASDVYTLGKGGGDVDIVNLIGGGHKATYQKGNQLYVFKYKCFPDTVKPQ